VSAIHRPLPHSFQNALEVAREILSSNHELIKRQVIETEAEQIVQGAYLATQDKKLSRTELFTKMSHRLEERIAEKVLLFSFKRAQGDLLQHILGYQTFLEHDYLVNASVLVPRPETESLVVAARDWIHHHDAQLGFEIGLGSGAISIELVASFSRLKMVASELTVEAIEVAEKNAKLILQEKRSRLKILRSSRSEDVAEPFQNEGRAEFLISNPPYLANASEAEEDVVKFEPASALFAPQADAFFFYRQIAQRGPEILKFGGAVFLEMPHERASEIQNLFSKDIWKTRIENDLSRRPRILIADLK